MPELARAAVPGPLEFEPPIAPSAPANPRTASVLLATPSANRCGLIQQSCNTSELHGGYSIIPSLYNVGKG